MDGGEASTWPRSTPHRGLTSSKVVGKPDLSAPELSVRTSEGSGIPHGF